MDKKQMKEQIKNDLKEDMTRYFEELCDVYDELTSKEIKDCMREFFDHYDEE